MSLMGHFVRSRGVPPSPEGPFNRHPRVCALWWGSFLFVVCAPPLFYSRVFCRLCTGGRGVVFTYPRGKTKEQGVNKLLGLLVVGSRLQVPGYIPLTIARTFQGQVVIGPRVD